MSPVDVLDHCGGRPTSAARVPTWHVSPALTCRWCIGNFSLTVTLELPSMSTARRKTEVTFDALGSPVRREILRLLARGPRPVGQIASRLPVSRPAVSKHLRLLQDAGLVVHETSGTRNLYRLQPEGFEVARSWLEAFWNEGLPRFKLVAENTPPRRKRG